MRICSVGSSLTLRMLADTEAYKNRQLDFIERHFRENIARDDPEAAAKAIEFVRRYRELRRGQNLSKEQLVLRAQLAEELERIWGGFKGGWEEFVRKAGADEILAAKRSGLVDFHRFAAGGVERTAGLDQSSNERRSDEFYEEVTAELFGVLSGAVSEGGHLPLVRRSCQGTCKAWG
jgi:hypothetical protein